MILRTVLSLLLLSILLHAEVLLDVDFDQHPLGTYSQAMAREDFPGALWYHGIDEGRGEIVAGPAGQGRVLRLCYPANTFGPQENAIQIKAVLSKAVDTAWASYKVMFEQGFDFVKGGKLPGLCGGDCITGGKTADGYNGWSARIMWREEGKTVQYVYYPDKADPNHAAYGEDMPYSASLPQKRFIPGTWHRVTTQIIMNSPGEANGVIRAYFDGELALERTSIHFRDTSALKTDQFYISTFYGGSSADWAPLEDMQVYYDDFSVISSSNSSSRPEALFALSSTNGKVPLHLTVNGSASLGSNLDHEVDFGNGVITAGPAAAVVYSEPGIFNFCYKVTGGSQTSSSSRKIFALGATDALPSEQWQGVAIGDSLLGNDQYLNLKVTILDSSASLLVGPSRFATPAGEYDLFGVLRYENGIFSALDGSSRTYDTAHGITGRAGVHQISFQCDFQSMTYNVWVDGIQVATDLPRRGYAKKIGDYGCWASLAQTAIIQDVEISSERLGDVSPIELISGEILSPKILVNAQGLEIKNAGQPFTIEIFNARGAQVKKLYSTEAKLVPLSSKGIYFYRLRTANELLTGSAVVK